jgi:hypothetical protein
MASRVAFSGEQPDLPLIESHHRDPESALRLYFSVASPSFSVRFVGYSQVEVAGELSERLKEADLTSSLAVLSALEAAFRIDYLQRCYLRDKSPVSRAFRDIYREKRESASLEDDIFGVWARESNAPRRIIGELRGAFRFRHWLAHGRYWTPKLGRRYDFTGVLTLALTALGSFPLHGVPTDRGPGL